MKEYIEILGEINKKSQNGFDGHCQILSGALSEVFYYLRYGLIFNDNKSIEKAYDILNYHSETANDYVLNYKFAHGLPGIAWLSCFLVNNGFLSNEYLENFDDIDYAIKKSLSWDRENKLYDYTVGALGKAQYFLEREKTDLTNQALHEILDILETNAIWNDKDSCTWLDYYTSTNTPGALNPKPFYNLGLGHGISSIVYFLCKLYKADINKSKCEVLIRGAINWLISQRTSQYSPYAYPNIVGSSVVEDVYNVQGWCHGLLSNSFSYFFAGKTLADSSYLNEFGIALKYCKKITVEKALSSCDELILPKGVKIGLDFCHGASGIIYMYDKLAIVTKNSDAIDLSKYWNTEVLQNIVQEKCLTGFYKYGILGGLPGLGMALLQKIDNTKLLGWDKALLLDFEAF